MIHHNSNLKRSKTRAKSERLCNLNLERTHALFLAGMWENIINECVDRYSQQHVRLYKTVKLHWQIFCLILFIIKHRFDWEYFTFSTNHAVALYVVGAMMKNFLVYHFFLFSVRSLLFNCHKIYLCSNTSY
jgi:hypothetical protein